MSDRIPLTDIEQTVAEMTASHLQLHPDEILSVTRELIALRALLAACRVAPRSLPRSVLLVVGRFTGLPATLRLRAAEADRRES
jgi:hypothetical protein